MDIKIETLSLGKIVIRYRAYILALTTPCVLYDLSVLYKISTLFHLISLFAKRLKTLDPDIYLVFRGCIFYRVIL